MASNAYRRTIIIAGIQIGANCIMLAAACYAMYQSFNHPATSLSTFCSWFFGITVPTWVVAKRAITIIRNRLSDSDEGMVRLPGRSRQSLMRWKVCERALQPERLQPQA